MVFQKLSVSDKVALACPASKILADTDSLDAVAYLKNQYELNATYNDDTLKTLSAKQKADIFLAYLFDQDVRAIFCLRGGEGSSDIIPYLHQHHRDIKNLASKPIVGFSDITALLVYFSQTYGWPVIHGPGLSRIVSGEIDLHSEKQLFDCLLGKTNETFVSQVKPINQAALSATQIKAESIGGTLSLINISVKDAWELNASKKILILEDVNEKGHVISRTLKYLKRIGMLGDAAAIVFGDFKAAKIGSTSDQVEKNNYWIDNAIALFAKDTDVPVFKTDQFGHGRVNHPVVFSTPSIINVKEECLRCYF